MQKDERGCPMTKQEMRTQVNKFYWFDSNNYDKEAYQEGYDECKRCDGDSSRAENPYKLHTISWFCWNYGWNSYWNSKW